MMKYRLIFLMAVTSVFLFSCTEAPKTADIPQSVVQTKSPEQLKEEFIQGFTGVWSSDGETITIYYDNNQMLVLYGDDRLDLTLGDTDTVNETMNLLTTDNKIITLRKQWNADKTQYKLSFIAPNGKSETIGFIRKITADDRNRIYAINNNQAQKELAETEEEIASLKADYAQAKSDNKDARMELNALWEKFDPDVKAALIDEQKAWVIAKKKKCGEPNGSKEKPAAIPLIKQDFESAIDSFECDTEETLSRIKEFKE